jgi:hypothetical protein
MKFFIDIMPYVNYQNSKFQVSTLSIANVTFIKFVTRKVEDATINDHLRMR